MIKNLVQHGNSKALIIDKSLLQAAKLDEKTSFQITIDPNGGLVIQSIQNGEDEERFQKSFKRVGKRTHHLMKRLSKK